MKIYKYFIIFTLILGCGMPSKKEGKSICNYAGYVVVDKGSSMGYNYIYIIDTTISNKAERFFLFDYSFDKIKLGDTIDCNKIKIYERN